jgi:hypothetical protein
MRGQRSTAEGSREQERAAGHSRRGHQGTGEHSRETAAASISGLYGRSTCSVLGVAAEEDDPCVPHVLSIEMTCIARTTDDL